MSEQWGRVVELWNDTPVCHYSIPESAPIREKARTEAEEMGALHGSIEDGKGNFAGLLAEFVVARVIDAVRRPTYEYDIVRNDVSIDVKTKRRTVKPKPSYDASIADYNTEQGADVYYFTSFNTESSVLSLLGYIPTDEYYEKATFYEEGDHDPDNNFTFKADCYNLPYEELRQCDIRGEA